ncbi:hypothetical protein ACA910_005803 [Epithemia clementina (nom. ined.)]
MFPVRSFLGRFARQVGRDRNNSRSIKNFVREDRYKIDNIPDSPFPDALIHRTALMEQGSRQYLLLPPSIELIKALRDPSLAYASLFIRNSVVFGARLHAAALREDPSSTIASVCPPLLEAALRDSPAERGEQAQAWSTLYGLCQWVRDGLEKKHQCDVLDKLWQGETIIDVDTLRVRGKGEKEKSTTMESSSPSCPSSDSIAQLEAVCALATGISRPADSPNMRKPTLLTDGRFPWEALAREFVQKQPSDECQLYITAGGELVEVQHDAEQSPKYMAAAGGAMARFFFM